MTNDFRKLVEQFSKDDTLNEDINLVTLAMGGVMATGMAAIAAGSIAMDKLHEHWQKRAIDDHHTTKGELYSIYKNPSDRFISKDRTKELAIEHPNGGSLAGVIHDNHELMFEKHGSDPKVSSTLARNYSTPTSVINKIANLGQQVNYLPNHVRSYKSIAVKIATHPESNNESLHKIGRNHPDLLPIVQQHKNYR